MDIAVALEEEQTGLQVICSASAPVIEYVTPSLVVEFAALVHQEQIASEQTVHFPIPHVQGQIVEGVMEILQECLSERIEERIVDTLHTMEEIVETVQILQERFQQSIEEQTVHALCATSYARATRYRDAHNCYL